MKSIFQLLLLATVCAVPVVSGAQKADTPVISGQSVDLRGKGRFDKGGNHTYSYIAANGKITCIQEMAHGEESYMLIRYFYDEDERFVAATSHEAYPKKGTTGWYGWDKVYVAGKGDTSRGSGVEKKVDDMAWEALMVCRGRQHNPKGAATPALEAQLKRIRNFRTGSKVEFIVNVSCAGGVYDVRLWDPRSSRVDLGVTLYNARGEVSQRSRVGVYPCKKKANEGERRLKDQFLQDQFLTLDKAMEGLTPEFISTNLPGKGWTLEKIGYVTPASAEAPWLWGVTFSNGDTKKHFLLQSGTWTPRGDRPRLPFRQLDPGRRGRVRRIALRGRFKLCYL